MVHFPVFLFYFIFYLNVKTVLFLFFLNRIIIILKFFEQHYQKKKETNSDVTKSYILFMFNAMYKECVKRNWTCTTAGEHIKISISIVSF